MAPADLVAAAAACGVTFMALTDHDTLAGYRDVIAAGAVPPSLDADPRRRDQCPRDQRPRPLGGRAAHPRLRDGPGRRRLRGRARRPSGRGAASRFERTVQRLRELGLSIDAQVEARTGDDDALAARPRAGAHAAGHEASVEDAFRRLLGYGCPAYVPREGLGPMEAIQAIRAAGGLAALAHFHEARARIEVVQDSSRAAWRPRGLLPLVRRRHDEVRAQGGDRARASCRPAAATTTATSGPYAQSHAYLWIPPSVADGVRAALGVQSARR